ncbi:hypothetical protein [Hydrocarboniphaga sp.]|uniref:hypothetical protein n=1 Tax=Hydrocarboniphaga sp. TaxID=2033016 RepID=UPI003D10C423
MILAVLLVGLIVGAGFGVPLAAGLVFLGAITWFLIAYGFSPFKYGAQGFFWTAVATSVGIDALGLIVPVPLGWLSDVALFLSLPFIVASIPQAFRVSRIMYFVTCCFAIAVLLGLISTYFSEFTNPKAAIYQFLYNARWPLMLLMGFRIGWDQYGEKRLVQVMIAFVIIVSLFLVLQFGAPGTYYRLFGSRLFEDGHIGNPLVGGHLPRGTGPFVISTMLAYFASVFCGFAWVLALQRRSEKKLLAYSLPVVLFVLLILSGQRQETATVLGTLGLVTVALKVKSPLKAFFLSFSVLFIAFALIGLLLGPKLLQILGEQWGFLPSFNPIEAARPVFVGDSIRLANTYFPFGTGFGTFAGNGARLFDRNLYEYLGYGAYWWYAADKFLLDTYWPNYVAELGWLGFSILFLIPIVICCYTWLKIFDTTDETHRRLRAYAFIGQIVPFGISLTSALYSSPGMVGFSMALFGMSLSYGKIAKVVERSRDRRHSSVIVANAERADRRVKPGFVGA